MAVFRVLPGGKLEQELGDCCSGLEVGDTLALTLEDWSVEGK